MTKKQFIELMEGMPENCEIMVDGSGDWIIGAELEKVTNNKGKPEDVIFLMVG